MKKTIAWILIFVLTLSLVGCAPADTDETTTAPTAESTDPPAPAVFMAGYSREDITPEGKVPLGGYGLSDRRLTDNVLDPLYLTCVAFQEGEEMLLWFTMDIIGAKGDMVAQARLRISRKTGVPADRIMFCATHTHSAPDLGSSNSNIELYKENFVDIAIEAAQKAIADLTPATLSGTKTELERMNYIRHYIMNDGTYYGSNFGSTASGFKQHVEESDNEMLLVKVEREGDKKDILLMNWQAHPCFTGGGTKKDISADYIGAVRRAIERDTGMYFAFYQGAQGNHNARSAMPNETLYSTNEEYGEKLAEYAIAALPNLKPIEGSGIKSEAVTLEAAVNHDDEHLLEQAREVQALWKSTNDTNKGNKLARQYGISSVYHANAIIARPSRPEKANISINAIYVGGLAFITAPFEMFRGTGEYIKDNSPFEMTFICGNSNESHGYIPTVNAYDYGCYESFTSYFARGTAEVLQEKYVEMLNGLK